MAIKKRAYSKTHKVFLGGSAGILSVFAFIQVYLGMYGFSVLDTTTGLPINPNEVIQCAGNSLEPCRKNITIMSDNWSLVMGSKINISYDIKPNVKAFIWKKEVQDGKADLCTKGGISYIWKKNTNTYFYCEQENKYRYCDRLSLSEYTCYTTPNVTVFNEFDMNGYILPPHSRIDLVLEIQKPINESVKWSLGVGSVLVDPVFASYTSDEVFTDLVENKADVTFGMSRFILKNPTSFDIPINPKYFEILISEYSGNSVNRTEVSYRKDWSENKTENRYVLVNVYNATRINGSVYEVRNYTLTPVTFEVSHTDYILINSTMMLKAKEQKEIKIVSYWKASLKPISKEWFPVINISGVKFKQIKWAWYNVAFGFKSAETVTSVSGNLTNFPYFINRTGVNGTTGLNRNSLTGITTNVSDFRPLLDDEITLLNCETTVSNSTTIQVWASRSVQSIGTNTTYIYYNATVANVCNKRETWDANFTLRLGFDENGGTTVNDSSQWNNNGTATPLAERPTWIQGKFGYALSFDSNTAAQTPFEAVILNNSASFSFNQSQDFTIEAWVNPNSVGGYATIFSVYSSTANTGFGYSMGITNTNKFYCSAGTNNVDGGMRIGTTTLETGVWYYGVCRFYGVNSNPARTTQVYLNGMFEASGQPTAINGSTPPNNEVGIGGNFGSDDVWSQAFNGTIDEIRVSNVARSNQWINATYQDVTSSMGAEQAFNPNTTISLLLDNQNANRSYELGTNVSVYANLTNINTLLNGIKFCIDIDQGGYGINVSCSNTSELRYNYTTDAHKSVFFNGSSSLSLVFASDGTVSNRSINISMHAYDEISKNASFDLSNIVQPNPFENGSLNVVVWFGKSLIQKFYGRGNGDLINLSSMNNSLSTESVVYSLAGSKIRYMQVANRSLVNFTFSIEGFPVFINNVSTTLSNLTIENQTSYSACGNYTYNVIRIINSTLNVCTYNGLNNDLGWTNLSANIMTIDENSTINATARGLGGGYGGGGGRAGGCPPLQGKEGDGGNGTGGGLNSTTAGCGALSGAGGGGAGGGGYGTSGGSGGRGGINGEGFAGGIGGIGGGTYGSGLNDWFNTSLLGSGGAGGGGGGRGETEDGNAGTGGSRGGGIVKLSAQNITISAKIYLTGGIGATGGSGGGGTGAYIGGGGGGGGGASGGLLIISGRNVTLNGAALNASGGNGGLGGTGFASGASGGMGGKGRIKIFYVSMANSSLATDGAVNYVLQQQPTNISVDLSADTISDWNLSGTLQQSNGTINVSFIGTSLSQASNYITKCRLNAENICMLPFAISSQTNGQIKISNIRLSYNASPIVLKDTMLNNWLKNYSGYVNISINISSDSYLEVSAPEFLARNLNISYHGSDEVNITAHFGGNASYSASNNYTLKANIYYSGYNYSFPTNIKALEFRSTPVAVNVSAFGQTGSIPIFNISFRNYDTPMNFSMRVNESTNCVNFTASNTSTPSGGFMLSTVFQNLWVNRNVNYNGGLWLWAHYNCSGTAWELFNPEFLFRGACIGCIADSGI